MFRRSLEVTKKLVRVASCAWDDEYNKEQGATLASIFMCIIFNNLQEDLLYESDNEIKFDEIRTCPEIDIEINGIKVKALVDTESQVTFISKKFYLTNSDKLKKLPTLPIIGTIIRGATGLKSTR